MDTLNNPKNLEIKWSVCSKTGDLSREVAGKHKVVLKITQSNNNNYNDNNKNNNK